MNEPARAQMMSEDGRQRLLHVRAVLSEALAQRGRQPVRRWVEGVWLQLGGASCLWEAGDVRDVQAFFELVQKLEEGGQFSTGLLSREVEKLFAAPDTLASDALQFMTIHKSKGLEFDTVILPGLHRGGASDDKALLLWEEVALEGATTQLVAAPLMPKRDAAGGSGNPSAYDYLRLLEQERSDNEAARVLYVGATRAVRRLHLVGVARQDGRSGEPKPPANTPLALLWSVVGGIFMQAAVEQVAPDDDSIRNFIPPLVRLVRPGVPAQLGRDGVGVVADVEEIPAAESSGSRLDADVGMLAHRYVEIMARSGLAGWTPQRISDLQPAMQHWLLQQGYDQADARRGASRVSAALHATLASEQGRWVLQQRNHAAVEMAWTSIEGACVRSHIIDRTFIENGERWVIDYKSARLGEVSEDVLERQAALYRPQLERYAGLFADEGLPVRRAVFFLAHGILVELT
ncbi:ATP-dependent helicase/nuclease subunit A [mine drainage metagenome]|uniref:ATP-dependent helicase/nuclease subunit A n=1 Tax=mine drainage metagenome TaxID=410659 RepID=A0A1J5QN94_9ZZZZ